MNQQNNFLKIKDDFVQYGPIGYPKRILKYVLRKLGIVIDSYYYMINQINVEECKKQFEDAQLPPVKQLTFEDFLKGDKGVFNEKKLSMIKQRLADDTFKAFGIVENGSLLYSCWISLKKLETSNHCVIGELNENEGLLIDAYCSPSARGRGIHGAMNAFRLYQIAKHGKDRGVAIVLKENTPAYKSQKKVGFKTIFVYTVIEVFGKSFTNYHKLKSQY